MNIPKRYFLLFLLIPFLFITFSPPPAQGQYLFPHWIVYELHDQKIPNYVYVLPGEEQFYSATVRNHDFKWHFYRLDDTTLMTNFSVSNSGVEFSGTNADYAEFALSRNWLALFGTLPGRSALASGTILGESVADFSSFVLGDNPALLPEEELPIDDKPTSGTSSFFFRSEYEEATYEGVTIQGYSLPVSYYKRYTHDMEGGVYGRIRYTTFSDASKTKVAFSPYVIKNLPNNLNVGGTVHLSYLSTSVNDMDIPGIAVAGGGAFANISRRFGKFFTRAGAMVEPKFGDSEYELPLIIGGLISRSLSPYVSGVISIAHGTNVRKKNEEENTFTKLDIQLRIGRIWSIGYSKTTGLSGYKNNALYTSFTRFF